MVKKIIDRKFHIIIFVLYTNFLVIFIKSPVPETIKGIPSLENDPEINFKSISIYYKQNYIPTFICEIIGDHIMIYNIVVAYHMEIWKYGIKYALFNYLVMTLLHEAKDFLLECKLIQIHRMW